jgi:hypothetical protein
LLSFLPAHAQTAVPDQKTIFASYMHSPGYKAFLERIFNLGEPATLKAECPTLKIVESHRYVMLEQPTFVRAGTNYNIDTGTWVGTALLDRCGTKVTRRALLKAVPGTNNLDARLLLPGDFPGNLKLEADAKLVVFPGLMGHAKCQDLKKFQILDIKALTPTAPAGWSETWIAEACGTKVEAEVTYSATATGMNIMARNWKTR